MNNFELCVHDRKLHEWIGLFSVIVLLPLTEMWHERERIGGNKLGSFDRAARSTNPVLALTESSPPSISTAHTIEQDCVKFEE